MDQQLESTLGLLHQKQITSRDQLLHAMLLVKTVAKNSDRDLSEKPQEIFRAMTQFSEEDMDFFPSHQDDFVEVFAALRNIDIIDFALAIYKDDPMRTIFAPKCISSFISERIHELQPKTILITEAEKHLTGLRDIVECFRDSHFTLTTELQPMYLLLLLAFEHLSHVNIQFTSIYADCLHDRTFEYIHCLPTFGHRPETNNEDFFTKDSEGIALENMLRHLGRRGLLDVIVPARVSFSSMGYDKLRSYINEHFHVQSILVLPEDTFRPCTAIKTYFLSITAQQQHQVEIGTFRSTLRQKDTTLIGRDEFVSYKDWRIELLLSDDNKRIQQFRHSDVKKAKLRDVAEIFRGKSILKKDLSPGDIFVLNLSDIKEGTINYTDMSTIDEEEQKVKRYELQTGDVVLSCRGTAIKSAVFQRQDRMVIASANLIIIRSNDRVMGEYLQIFLESPVGQAMIKSFQRGTTVMNINYADIMEMEIPLYSMEKQQEIVAKYQEERGIYQAAIQKATQRWFRRRSDIYDQLL